MSRNVEIKARVADPVQVKAKAETLGPSERHSFTQTDTFFCVTRGRLKLREFGDGSAEMIFYERSDELGPKLSRYRRTPVVEPVELAASLSDALGTRGVVRKHREVLIVGQTRIHLDHVEALGHFLELEVVLTPEQSVENGERIAHNLLASLGISDSALVSCAYIDLLAAQTTDCEIESTRHT